MSFNQLKWISEGEFKGLTGATDAFLSGNPIESCDPNVILKDLASVKRMYIHGGTPTASLQEAVDILERKKKAHEKAQADLEKSRSR